MSTIRFLRRAGAAALLPLLLAVAPLAHAGHTAIDSNCDGSFGTPGPPSPGSGQCFNDPVPVVLNGDQTSPAIAMGFSITIAGKSYNQIFINENGVVSFGQGLPSGSFPGGTLATLGSQFTDPATPFAAAAYLNLNTPAAPVTVDPVGGTAYVMYQTGVADPRGGEEDPAGNIPAASSTGLPPAIAIVWSDPSQASVGSGLGFQAQLVIYSLNGASNTPGDFAIRFRYGSQSFGDNPVVGSQAGYSLGSGVVTLAGLGYPEPYNNAPTSADPNGTVDYYFKFIQTAPPPPPLTLACPAAAATVGTAYNSAFSASGGVTPYAFSDTGSLPTGLTLNAITGALTGTPSAAGPFAFTAKVVDSSGLAAGTVTTSCAITVSPAASKLRVTPLSLAFGTVERFSLLYKTVTLTNTGTAPVSLSRASISSGNAHGDFAALSLCGSSLAAGKSCPIYVVLFALDLGSLSATLNIPNNAAGSPQTIPLSVTVQPR